MKATTIDRMLQQSASAFLVYRNTSGKKKALFLKTIAAELEAIRDSLCATVQEESHLPEARVQGELGRTTNQLKSFASLLEAGHWVQATVDTADPDRKPLPKPDIRKMFVAVGPVVVFGASNFPLAFSTAGGDTASALAAGCPVIVKSHPAHPRTSKIVADVIQRSVVACSLPEFTFQHLEDSSFEAGQLLVQHPLTKSVAFTGSFQGGKALYDLAVSRPDPIPVFAEMGSVNPVVVLPDVLNKNKSLGEIIAASVLQGVGQFCTNPGLILTLDCAALPSFLELLATHITKAAPAKMLHGGIASSYRSRKKTSLSMPGVSVLAHVEESNDDQCGAPALAMVNANEFISTPTLHEEIFGPFSLIVKCNDEGELLSVIKHLQGQLTASVFSTESDNKTFSESITALQQVCGRLIFNMVPTGVEVCKAMHHGGPFPATTDSRFTSVGNDAIYRFVRPLSFQNAPAEFLPPELRNENDLNIFRWVNNAWTDKKL
jgi:alpha-ketoglutaric semialdehyde dehydrogenase